MGLDGACFVDEKSKRHRVLPVEEDEVVMQKRWAWGM